MSTLKADTIQNTSGGAATLTKQEAAKSWVNFNGTGTIAARDSLNLSGLTDNGTANYTISLSSAHSDANFVLVCAGSEPGGGKPHVAVPHNVSDTEYAPTSSTYRIGMLEPGTAWADAKYVNGQTHGDLA